MIQNIIAYAIIAAAVFAATLYLVKRFTNKDKGCCNNCNGCGSKSCPYCKED